MGLKSISKNTKPKEIVNPDNPFPEVAEAPRFTCSLGGAYGSALATFGAVPILHSGQGCGMANAHGLTYASGANAGGAQGTTTTPCSGLIEEHVVFGGEDKLRKLIASTIKLMKGSLFAVISGCVPALIGDDVDSVVAEFADEVPIVHVKTTGFVGNAFTGYETYLDALIDGLLKAKPVEKKRVNLLGIVPNMNIFWKGDLAIVKRLLESIGVKVNTILADFDSLNAIQNIPAAELNIVLNPWVGLKAAEKLKERYGTPYEHFRFVPVGPKESSRFLQTIGNRLKIPAKKVNEVIAREEQSAYRYAEYLAEMFMIAMPHSFFAVVADSRTVTELVKYGANELGWNPELVIITDNPPEEYRKDIENFILDGLLGIMKPKVVFEIDSHRIRLLLREHTLQVIWSSSLEKYISKKEHEAHHLSVSYPVYDRLVVDRSYAGYRGGLALLEDMSTYFAGPL